MRGDDGHHDHRDAAAGNAAQRMLVDDDRLVPHHAPRELGPDLGDGRDLRKGERARRRHQERRDLGVRIVAGDDIADHCAVLLLVEDAAGDLGAQKRIAACTGPPAGCDLRPLRKLQRGEGTLQEHRHEPGNTVLDGRVVLDLETVDAGRKRRRGAGDTGGDLLPALAAARRKPRGDHVRRRGDLDDSAVLDHLQQVRHCGAGSVRDHMAAGGKIMRQRGRQSVLQAMRAPSDQEASCPLGAIEFLRRDGEMALVAEVGGAGDSATREHEPAVAGERGLGPAQERILAAPAGADDKEQRSGHRAIRRRRARYRPRAPPGWSCWSRCNRHRSSRSGRSCRC